MAYSQKHGFRGAAASGSVALLLAACSGGSGPEGVGSTAVPAVRAEDLADQRAASLVAVMSLAQKIQLVHGTGLDAGQSSALGLGYELTPPGSLGGPGFIPGIPALGIPDYNAVDSSSGVNLAKSNSTSLPATIGLAASWDTELAHQFGRRTGIEARTLGFAEALGGGINLAFDPRNGRNFEYMGEDPVLAGELVAARVQGVQEQKVVSTIKHLGFNNYETDRLLSNSVVDEQTMRETELLGFEIGVTKGRPGNVMCAYNLVNGVYACEHAQMIDWLKNEWGFKGKLQSDWTATASTVAAANAGLDEEQPSQMSDEQQVSEAMRLFAGEPFFIRRLADAVATGQVPMARLDDMVRRRLRTMISTGVMDSPPRPGGKVDETAGNLDALKFAQQSMVLLQNRPAGADGAPVLPLAADRVRRIAVIGGRADSGVITGSGSGSSPPINGNAVTSCEGPSFSFAGGCAKWLQSSPLQALRRKFPGAAVSFLDGTDAALAADAAAAADVAVVFAISHEGETVDRSTLSLPTPQIDPFNVAYHQDTLIGAVAAKARRTVVVLETGAPVLMPWLGQVHAVLQAWHPGIRGGEAIADILAGDVNPSAKLPITFPAREADLPYPRLPNNLATLLKLPLTLRFMVPAMEQQLGAARFDALRSVHYDKKLLYGYRWYDARGLEPLFAFGHGLSYTSYAYSGLSLARDAADSVMVHFTLTNTGSRAGSEVAQVYASLPPGVPGHPQPPKRLVGWKKVALAPGQSAQVSVQVPARYLSTWDAATRHAWVLHSGSYTFTVAPSSRTTAGAPNVLKQTLSLGGA